jgi:two-component system, chemotaxis family, response regulator Rcp1
VAMTSKIEVLLVDDNPADSDLTRELLEQVQPLGKFRLAANGAEAIACLRRQGCYKDGPEADFVLLDLNMPVKDGRSLLAEVKCDPSLRAIPIVVFSSSSADDDVRSCYQLGANCFVTKPGNLQDYITAVKALGQFWLKSTCLPGEEAR